MKNKKLLYIPFTIIFLFSISVLSIHYANITKFIELEPAPYKLPFAYFNGVVNLTEQGRQAGLEVGDKIISYNGSSLGELNELLKRDKRIESPDPITLEIERKDAKGNAEQKIITITPIKIERNLQYYSGQLLNFAFIYLLPTFCILLGLWVVFVRPHDYLAWLLYLLLSGLSVISFEAYEPDSLIGFYRSIFFNTWALSMFLFGVYFPERWSVDKKIPWAKWIFIVPLSFQILLLIIDKIAELFGLKLAFIENFFKYEIVGISFTIINLVAMGMFFAILTHKATSLKNSDSRRRLKLMATGTIASMLPLFLLFLYRMFTGVKGSLFDIVPTWVAVFALLMLLLFPITMAYVIVVQRAMNVSVVVRQGLQYALAKNGVLMLQILLSIGVILTALSFASDNTTNRPQKITFIAVGIASVFLIRLLADKIKVWVDRKFFREAYNAEQILTELSEEVRTMVETQPLLEKVSNKISESMHVPQVTMLLRNGDSFQPAYAVGYENLPIVALDKNDKTIGKISNNESLVIYQDVVDYWVNEEIQTVEKEALEKLNSQLLLPIGVKNELAGVISLSPKLSEEPFTPNDLRLLKSVASQTGLALENSRLTATIAKEAAQKERLNRELEIAREVQERLFPQEKPEIEGLDFHGTCRTALDVGGDYYDFLEFDDGKFGIAIGDISGKGIGASLMMASLQASLRGQSLHYKNDLAGLMSQINHLLYDASTSNRYATFFYSQYDPKTRNLIYVTAGHDPPYLLRKKDDELEVIKLDKGGPVVGMLPPMLVSYEQGEIILQKGDLIVSSTDGITEAMNPKEEEWGEESMFAELKKVYGKSAEEIAGHIISKADEFAAGAKQHDDMTMIVVRVM